jgi:protein TonB
LFKNRNKEYGGYALRKTYAKRFLLSFVLVISFVALVTGLLFVNEVFIKDNRLSLSDQINLKTVSYEDEMLPVLNLLPQLPEPGQKPVLKPETNTAIALRQDVAPLNRNLKEQIKPTVITDTSLKKIAEKLLKKREIQPRLVNPNDTLTILLDEVPQFPGGLAAIRQFFVAHQKYPKGALVRGIYGDAIVSFQVNKEGKVEKPKIIRGIDPELDFEAIRLISLLPQWKPGYYNGEPITCMMVLPVEFVIKK